MTMSDCIHGPKACCNACHKPGCKKKKVFTPDPKDNPLEVALGYLNNLSDEEWKEARERALKEREEREQDERDKRNYTGKYDPKNNPVGRCRVCPDGDVIMKLKTVESNPGLIGPGNKHYKVLDCYHCNSCGLMYAFPPKKAEEK